MHHIIVLCLCICIAMRHSTWNNWVMEFQQWPRNRNTHILHSEREFLQIRRRIFSFLCHMQPATEVRIISRFSEWRMSYARGSISGMCSPFAFPRATPSTAISHPVWDECMCVWWLVVAIKIAGSVRTNQASSNIVFSWLNRHICKSGSVIIIHRDDDGHGVFGLPNNYDDDDDYYIRNWDAGDCAFRWWVDAAHPRPGTTGFNWVLLLIECGVGAIWFDIYNFDYRMNAYYCIKLSNI